MSGALVPEIEGRIKKVVLSAPRRSISNLDVLRAIKNETRIPPGTLKNAFHGLWYSKKKRLATWAIYFCYQYADTSIAELAELFNSNPTQIKCVVMRMPDMNNDHLPEFEVMDQAIRRMIEARAIVLPYDLRKQKVMSLADVCDAQKKFNDPEHRLYEWFVPNTFGW